MLLKCDLSAFVYALCEISDMLLIETWHLGENSSLMRFLGFWMCCLFVVVFSCFVNNQNNFGAFSEWFLELREIGLSLK